MLLQSLCPWTIYRSLSFSQNHFSSFVYSELITPHFYSLRVCLPPHGPFQLGLGDVEIAQGTVIIRPRLGE